MDRRQITDVLVLHGLGIEPSMDQFRDRLVVQKAIYLAQAAGLDLGYHYGWYLRGPYCSELAKDMFAAVADPNGVDDALERWKLDKPSRDELRKLQALVGELDAELPRRLELLASVHFLIKRGQVADHGPKEITQRLKAFGKNFTQEEVLQAIHSVEQAGLLTED